jgi:hypothetical protein
MASLNTLSAHKYTIATLITLVVMGAFILEMNLSGNDFIYYLTGAPGLTLGMLALATAVFGGLAWKKEKQRGIGAVGVATGGIAALLVGIACLFVAAVLLWIVFSLAGR